MIEERAVVSRVDGQQVWVRPFGNESCARCREGRGCGGGMINRLVSSRRRDIEVHPGRTARMPVAGDTVIIGIDESALMQAALAVYAVPVAGLLAGGTFAHLALQAPDLLVAGFGLLGLVAGFVVTRGFSQRAQQRPGFQPVLLRRDTTPEGCAVRG